MAVLRVQEDQEAEKTLRQTLLIVPGGGGG